MALNSQEKDYPICDTDIWVKLSKYNRAKNKDLLFAKHESMFLSDAVKKEIFRQGREKHVEDFECAQSYYKISKKNNKVKLMKLSNTRMFNEKQKQYVLRTFNNNKIYYDEEKEEFVGTVSNVGEKVTVIYASVHDLKIILSDDSDTMEFAQKKFPTISSKIMNLRKILSDAGYNVREREELIKKINTPMLELDSQGYSSKKSGSSLSNYKLSLAL